MATQSYKSLGTYLRVCPLFYELMLLCLSDTNDFILIFREKYECVLTLFVNKCIFSSLHLCRP